MAVSNSAFFQVIAVPPMEGSGWEVRVLDYQDFTTTVAVIGEFAALSVGPELSAAGAGSITLDADSPLWQTVLPTGERTSSLLDHEFLWEAWEDGVRRFQWLGRNVQETIVDTPEGLSRTIVVSGPGAAEVMRWAKILPPGFPTPPPPLATPIPDTMPADQVTYRLDVVARGWEFPPGWAAMQMWWTMFTAAQMRGSIPWIDLTFADTRDSAGQVWEYVPTVATTPGVNLPGQGYRPTMGMDLLDFLNECTGQDYTKHFAMRAEWFMHPGFQLEARKVIGVHRENEVVFYDAALSQKERTRVRDEIANYVAVVDAYGGFSISQDSASIAKWNKREQWENSNQNVVDAPRRDAITQIYLEKSKDEKSEWIIRVPYDEPGRRPFRDYNVGDWVGVSNYVPGLPSTVDAYRVLAIVVNVADDVPTVELTLQTRIDWYQRQLQAQLTQLVNQINQTNQTVVNNPPTGPNEPPPDYVPPKTDPYDPYDPYDPGSGGGGGYGDGVRVFIQSTDPGSEAKPGDFWYDLAQTPEYEPVPVEPYQPPVDEIDYTVRERVPGTDIWFE